MAAIPITHSLPVPGPSWSFNREERNAVAVLFGLLARPGNLATFARLLEWQPNDIEDAEVSVEYALAITATAPQARSRPAIPINSRTSTDRSTLPSPSPSASSPPAPRVCSLNWPGHETRRWQHSDERLRCCRWFCWVLSSSPSTPRDSQRAQLLAEFVRV